MKPANRSERTADGDGAESNGSARPEAGKPKKSSPQTEKRERSQTQQQHQKEPVWQSRGGLSGSVHGPHARTQEHWLAQRQIQGDRLLNYDPDRGEVKAPLVLWGPYLWACGNVPRKCDGLVWPEQDVRSNDHLHPSEDGCKRVTGLLLKFLKTDAGTRRWFVKYGGG